LFFFFFSSRRRHTRLQGDWSSDVCSSDLVSAEREERERSCLNRFGGLRLSRRPHRYRSWNAREGGRSRFDGYLGQREILGQRGRSEERRVGKEGRPGGWR